MTDIVERLDNLLEADPDPAMCELYATCKAEIERLTAARDAAMRVHVEDGAEIERLRGFAQWVETYSNDPNVVKQAHAAIKDTKPDIVECAKCGAPVKYGSCCNECDEPSDHTKP